jgi:hypothetical protein
MEKKSKRRKIDHGGIGDLPPTSLDREVNQLKGQE